MISTTARSAHMPPGPRGRPLLGNLPDMQRKGMLQFYSDLWRDYGDTVHVKMGPLHQFLLTQPEHVHHVLATNASNYCKGIGFKKLGLALGNGLFISEGELWQSQRRLLQPPFTARGITQFAETMVASTEDMLARWDAARSAAPLDINLEMMRLAMAIIGRTMFGTYVGDEALAAGDAFTYVLNFMSERSVTLFDPPLFVPTAQNREFKRSMQLLRSYMHGIISARRAQPNADATDLLSILLNARDEETGTGMSEQQLYDEVLTIFFAGHETTAQALTWSWFLLAQHPEAEEKLHAELAQALGGRTPTFADVPKLPYTRMVIQEALRLYPPVWIFVRDAIGADEIGGYPIPPRSMIVLSPFLTQRNPALWEHPEQFEPERFAPERAAARPHYAYFPFGGGKRTCLGDKFAMLEAQLVLATVAQRYRLRLVPGQNPQPEAVGTLRPAGGMPMTLEPRAS